MAPTHKGQTNESDKTMEYTDPQGYAAPGHALPARTLIPRALCLARSFLGLSRADACAMLHRLRSVQEAELEEQAARLGVAWRAGTDHEPFVFRGRRTTAADAAGAAAIFRHACNRVVVPQKNTCRHFEVLELLQPHSQHHDTVHCAIQNSLK